MTFSRRSRRVLVGLLLYAAFCVICGVLVCDGALHPARRALTEEDVATVRQSARELGAELEDASITAADGVVLRAWMLRPHHGNGDEVLLLHGVGDNRVGMTRYATFLLAHGYTVLLADARAQGASGGSITTYGLAEREDIRGWFDFLEAKDHPQCVFGLGESMGAAELLQSLELGTRFCAVVAESPFANFREIAYDRMGQPFHLGPWVGRTFLRPLVEVAFLRARWKYKVNMDQVSPEDAVATTNVPVLLIHGQVDSNIPLRHSRLIQARNAAVQLWEVPGADHCGGIGTAPEEFEQRVLGWFGENSMQRAGN